MTEQFRFAVLIPLGLAGKQPIVFTLVTLAGYVYRATFAVVVLVMPGSKFLANRHRVFAARPLAIDRGSSS